MRYFVGLKSDYILTKVSDFINVSQAAI